MLDEHNMIMIGGYSTSDCNDCWIFNTKTKLWKKVKPFIDYVYGIINVITKYILCKPENISSSFTKTCSLNVSV